jgi:hypothetical protein
MSNRQRIRASQIFPLDADGEPTSQLAIAVIRKLFTERNRQHSVAGLAAQIDAPFDLVRILCTQLTAARIIRSVPGAYCCYQYDLNSPLVELQAAVERAILEN